MEINLQFQLNHFIYPFCIDFGYLLKHFLFVISQIIYFYRLKLLVFLSFIKNLNITNPKVYFLIASDLCLILHLHHLHFNFCSLYIFHRYHLYYHPHLRQPHLHHHHHHHHHHYHHHHDLSQITIMKMRRHYSKATSIRQLFHP